MKNILIVTPMFKIIGRNDIIRDTECIYDLVKYWPQEELRVLVPHIRPFRQIINFLSPNMLKDYFNGYEYMCENIDVMIIERQNIFKGQKESTNFDVNRMLKIIKHKYKSFEPSMIIVHIPSHSELKLIEKLPFKCKKIAILHYSDVIYLNEKKAKYIEFLEKNFISVFCRSKAIYNVFKNNNLKNLRTEIISSGVPKQKYDDSKIAIRKKFSDINKFLYVGKLIKRKNLDLLISALNRINHNTWNLTVIGDGPCKSTYQHLVNELKLENNVSFIGQLPKTEVFKHMQEADIFCMPSINETLGLVYIEAMANGCITIGTKNEGIDGIIVDGDNGFLVEASEESIYLKINEILNYNQDDKERIIKNAIKVGNIYNEEDMSKKYHDIVLKEINNNEK